jgi:tripartite-type tricarboxylate transporter receptor subunit TctC
MTFRTSLVRRPLFLTMIVATFAIAAAACGASDAGGADFSLPTPVYPDGLVTFVVGADDGTFETDFANTFSAAFSVASSGQVSVVPMPGSNGVTAVENFGTNPRDGHWFLMINSDQTAAVATGVTDVDVTRDYQPIQTGTLEPFVFVAGSGSDFSDWGDVVSAASSGSVTVGVKGPETGAAALNAVGIADAIGLTLETTPAGDPAARIATANGLGLMPLGEAFGLVNSGAGTALLVLGPAEVSSLPGVPTALSEGSSFEGLPYLRGISISTRTPSFTKDNIGVLLRAAKASAPYQEFLAASGLQGIEIPAGDAGLTFRSQIPEFEALAAK